MKISLYFIKNITVVNIIKSLQFNKLQWIYTFFDALFFNSAMDLFHYYFKIMPELSQYGRYWISIKTQLIRDDAVAFHTLMFFQLTFICLTLTIFLCNVSMFYQTDATDRKFLDQNKLNCVFVTNSRTVCSRLNSVGFWSLKSCLRLGCVGPPWNLCSCSRWTCNDCA